MAKVSIVMEDKGGKVHVGVQLDERGLPAHPRLFTNAQEVADGVLKMMQGLGLQVHTLTEIADVEGEIEQVGGN